MWVWRQRKAHGRRRSFASLSHTHTPHLSRPHHASLTDAGHVALIAGGWVRDALLGRRSVDVDIATSAPPSAVAALFDRVVPMPNDTLIVVLEGAPFEMTPFRTPSGAGRGGGGGGGGGGDRALPARGRPA